MKTMKKRVLSLFMVFAMLFGMMPVQAFADGAASPAVKIELDADECTCGAAEGEPHAEDCPLYEAPEEAAVVVTVEPGSLAMLSTDGGRQLTAAVTGAEASALTWSVVSGDDVISVDGSGLNAIVMPKSEAAAGTAVVRVSAASEGAEAAYADCTVTVTRVNKSLEVVPGQVSMFVSSLGTALSAVVQPFGTDADAQWASSNPAVADVDANGHVTPVAAGTAVITASAQGMTATCTVTVKEVKYRVVYNSNYPADAKKFAYQNGNKNSGKDSSPLVDAENTNAVYEVQNGQTHTIIAGLSCANYDFVGWSRTPGASQPDADCAPGSEITVDDNLSFYAVWRRNTATTTKTVYIDYCYVDANGKSIKNTRSVTAYLVGQDESGNERYSFQLGNCADGLVTAAQNDRTIRGWIINGTNYNFNATCTTTLDENGHVRADAWQDTSLVEEEAFAQFFVHKYRVSPGGSVGTATVDYYSVGTGKVKVVLQKVKDRVGGNVSDDVSAYVLEAPSAAQIASALQIPLSESENIRWFKVIWADDGYHVDGVIYSINKNWTVKFIDPLAGNKVVRSVSVEDKGSLNNFPAGPSHAGEEFECWVDEAGKPISAIDVVVQDRTVYAKYKDKVMLTGVIDYGTVTNASQTVVSNQKTQAMVFTADDNRVITSVHVNDKAQSIKANQKTYTFTARNLTANTYVVVTTKGADALIRFDANGGTGEPSPVKGEFGAAVESPFPTKQPVRLGYTFDGWYTEPNGGSRVVGFPDTFDKLETVYYAHWKENVVTVTITGNYITAVYDGQEHKAVGYTVSSDNPAFTAADVGFSGTAEAATTDAAKVPMGLNPSQFTSTNPNFTKVNFVVVDGYVEVTPLDVTVTVTGNTDSKPYDGQEHSVSGYKFESSNALYTQNDVTFTGNAEAKRTDVGTTPMGLSDKDFANTNPNFHVDFNVIDGGMTITAAAAVKVTIIGNHDTVTYDGKTHSAVGYTVKSDNALYTAADFAFSGKAEAERTDAGTTKMGLEASQFTNKNSNYSNVTFVIEDGYIKVEPLAVNVAIEGNSVTAVYDGKEHTAEGYTVTSDSKVYDAKNVSFTGEAVAKRTDEGETPMGLKTEQFSNTNANFNVSFTVKDGGVKINPVDEVVVTIVGNHDSKVYDGQEHTVSGYTVTNISSEYYTEADFAFNGKAEAKRTDVGKTPMGLTAAAFSNKNNNFAKVTFQVTDGYMEITPVAAEVTVTITGHKASAEYDGQEHSVTGYDVKIEGELYKASDFTFNGTAEAKTTDAAKVPMGLKAEDFVNNNKNFSKVNFVVVDGGIEVTPKDITVTVTGNTDTKPYDGTEHTVTGYKVETGNDLLTEKDITFTGTAEAKRTEVGTTPMGLTDKDFGNTNPNFNVTFDVTDGGMTITAAAAVKVTVTGNHETVTYDGQEHTVTGYTVKSGNPLYTAADFTFKGNASAKRTDAGKTDMGLKAADFVNTNPNFSDVTFEVVDGYIQVNPLKVNVTVTGSSESFPYDGEEHKVTGYTVTSDSDLYSEKDVTFTGNDEAKRTEAGETPMGLTDKDFTNTNPNFDITFTVEDGGVKIDPVDKVVVTIVGNHDSKVYNGTEQSVTGYTVTNISSKLYTASDFTFNGTAEAKRTDVGKTDMGLKAADFANTNKNFTNVTFQVTDGYMEITPIAEVTVTVTGHSEKAEYDGSEHKVTGYDVKIEGDLYKASDFTFKGNAEAKTTDAAKVPMGLKAEDFVNNNKNFAKVNFVVVDGGIEVTPKNVTVTVTGNTDTAAYDGTEHTVTGYKVETGSDLLTEKDITFTGNAEAKRTDAGTTPMGLTGDDFTNTNPNFNVTFDVTDGGITVTPAAAVKVTVTGNHETVTYDGQEHTVSGYTFTADNAAYTAADFTYRGKAEAKKTNAGTDDMELDASLFQNTNPNFTDVTFEVVDGYIKVEPLKLDVTIIGNSDTFTYDGKEHEVTGYTVSSDSELYTKKNVAFTGNASVKRTDVGEDPMGLSKDAFTNTNANFDVTFTVEDGGIKIVPADEVVVTIVGSHDSKVYDGKEHTAEGYTFSASNPAYKAKHFSFTGTAEAKQTDVGKKMMELKPEQFANISTNFTKVSFEVIDGYMEITPVAEITVTITGHKASAEYDGQEHSVTGYDVKIEGDLYKASDFTFNGTAEAKTTDAATVAMGLKAEDFVNNNKNFSKVNFVVVDGGIEVTPKDVTVTVTGNTDSKPYDGTEHTVTGYQVETGNDLLTEKDITFTGTAEAKRTEVGTTPMGLTDKDFGNTNPNFNVTFNVIDGGMTITPAAAVKVTVTGSHDTVTYDGQEHSVTGYTFKSSNPLYGAADFSFSGTAEAKRTDAGKTDMGLKAEDFVNTNPNFSDVTFEIVDGYIQVDPLKVNVTVTGNSDTFPYDGEEHKVTGYTVTSDSDLYNEKDVTFTGSDEAKRTEAGETPMGLTDKDFTNTNPNFDITFTVEDGSVKIDPVDKVVVTIVGNHDSKVYNGTEQSVSGYTVTNISSPLYTASDFSFNGNAEAKRTDVGKTDMGLKAADFANSNKNFTNVTFQVTDGYMEITPIAEVTVTITGHSDKAEYDGKEHKVTGYEATIGNDLYKASDFTFNGTAEAKTTDAAKVPMGLKAEDFVNNNPNFAKVNFVVTDGGIEVTPKNVTVTVTGNTDTATYDGTEHTVTGYKVETGNDLLTEKDITFTGTAEAKRTDAGTTPMGLKETDFTNTNPNFNVTFDVTDGGITVEPLESITVVIKGHTDTVTYDGEEHTVTGYDVEIKTPGYSESDIGFTGTGEVKGTDTGSYEMGLKPEDFVNNNPNVKEVIFEVVDGGLELKALDVKVTIEGTADSHVYDGQEHKAEGYSFTSDSKLYTEDMLSFAGTAVAKRTDVGTTDMGLKGEDFENTNSNFNVTVTVKDGSMTITPVKEITVTINGHKATAVYDGTEHTASGYDVTVSDLLYTAQDFTFSGTAEAKRTNAGETLMGLKADQFANNNQNFESVKFVVNDGSMTITPLDVKVTVTGHSDTTPYDGNEHTVTGYEITGDSNLFNPEDVTFTGSDEAKRTEAGKTDMGLKDDQFQNNNENFHFTFEINDGGITIEPITDEVVVTLKGNTAGGVYNGQDYIAEGYTVESISNKLYKESFFSLAAGQEAKAVRKDVGKTDMGLTSGSFVNNSESFTNVRFVVIDGYVEVTPAKVIVTVDDKTVTYGEPDPELTVTVTGTIGDDTVDYDITRETGGDAGDHKVTVTGDKEQGNYVVEYVDGKVTVEARTLIITAGDMQWEYDGNDHTGSEKPDNFTVGSGVAGQGLVGTDSVASVTFSGSIKLPGTTDNIPSNAVFASGSASNYDIQYVPGTLKVTDRSVKYTVTVTADSAEFLYDGTVHAVDSFTVNAAANNTVTAALTGKLPKSAGTNAFSIGGHTYTVSGLTAHGELVDAGKALVAFSGDPIIRDDEGSDVTAQFSVNRISGQIIVNPRKVTLQSDNAAKVYDGTALTNHKLIIGGADGFVPGEGVTANITGSQTGVGTSQNAFTYTFNENTKASNYVVTVIFGNLSVYDVPVYQLTIHYVYEDGSQAAVDYHGSFAAGEAYTVISPAIDGYHADALYIRSGAKGMPAANVEFTVTYRKDTIPEKGVEIVPDPTDPGDYDITVIEENEVPLASGGHVDDIMHFLLMAAALVVQLVYFKKRKKYTEEIFDLHKQLGDTDMDDMDDMN